MISARDGRVITLRVLALGLLCPLVVESWDALAGARWVDDLVAVELVPTRDWFSRFVVFVVLTVVLPVSLLERAAAARGDTPRIALLAAALAGGLAVPGALAAVAQTAYAPDVVGGGEPGRALARAIAAAVTLVDQPPREVAGRALAFATPLAVVTWARVRRLALRLQLAVSAALSAGLALGALLGIAAWSGHTTFLRSTDLWTSLLAALLLPACYAAVDALERRVWPPAPRWQDDPPSAPAALA